MAKLSELASRAELTPSELKRFGKRVKYFDLPDDSRKWGGLSFAEAKAKLFKEIEDYVKSSNGQLYTGIHRENDWSKTRWWSKGGHLVNRTLEFAVIVPK